MELKDFIFGEIYQLRSSYGIFLGRNPVNPNRAKFQWIDNPNKWLNTGLLIGGGNLERMTLKYPEGKLTPKERVHKRCKDLWNRSNWVKQHPQQAY